MLGAHIALIVDIGEILTGKKARYAFVHGIGALDICLHLVVEDAFVAHALQAEGVQKNKQGGKEHDG